NLVAAMRHRPVDDTRYLRWAALLHDVGKARTKRFRRGRGWTLYHHEEESARLVPVIFERLRLLRDARMDYVRDLVRLHHRPHALVDEGVTDSAVRRLLFDAGDLVDDLMTLVRADLTTKNPRRRNRYLAGFARVEEKMQSVEARDHVRNFQPPVRGEEIMAALGVSEGLAVGILKERLKEAILEGEVPNEHAAAWAFVQQHAPDALRRGHLFDRLRTELPPKDRRALGALRDTLATAALPDEDNAAWAFLMRVKDDVLEMGGARTKARD
ncbi:MAG TPA: HD domain-containing protein, partial [Rhodothermales bacterium]|nr:HD domain-containing protein [Rhodothermales bacterium]